MINSFDKNDTKRGLLLHFSDDSATISKERYYRLLEIEAQYHAQQQETQRLQGILEEVISHFEDNSQNFKDDSKIIYFRKHLQKRMG